MRLAETSGSPAQAGLPRADVGKKKKVMVCLCIKETPENRRGTGGNMSRLAGGVGPWLLLL